MAPLRVALSAFALLAGAAAQVCNPLRDPFCCRDKVKSLRCSRVVFGGSEAVCAGKSGKKLRKCMRKKGKPWKCEKRGFELKCRKTCNDEKVQRTGEATWACAAPSDSFHSVPCKCATFEGGAKPKHMARAGLCQKQEPPGSARFRCMLPNVGNRADGMRNVCPGLSLIHI